MWLSIETPEHMIDAIQNLSIRGAPLLGLAGIYGLYVSAKCSTTFSQFLVYSQKIRNARPTAVNLSKMVDRILERYTSITDLGILQDLLLREAFHYEKELEEESNLISTFGATLIETNDSILTHCNTGSLATLGLGTALGVIKQSYFQGKNISVFFTETRPLLQGARLTSYELWKSEIPATMIIESSVGFVMQNKLVNKVIVGADRIAVNGDTANKIGTYMIAVLAKENKIPFYIAAPCSTFDKKIQSGKDIMIEYRSGNELSPMFEENQQNIINPAFDITPIEFISGFITEKGILKQPDL
jgi:methylthioribose-1-phosphate isomerase